MMTEVEWSSFERIRRRRWYMPDYDKYQMRADLFDIQGHVCGICGGTMEWEDTTIDHVIPRAMNGEDRHGNFVCAHRWCNSDKAANVPTGCTLVWLLAVNGRMGLKPDRW